MWLYRSGRLTTELEIFTQNVLLGRALYGWFGGFGSEAMYLRYTRCMCMRGWVSLFFFLAMLASSTTKLFTIRNIIYTSYVHNKCGHKSIALCWSCVNSNWNEYEYLDWYIYECWVLCACQSQPIKSCIRSNGATQSSSTSSFHWPS